jgi:DNA-binding NarL/FixJ family response regulator
MPGHEAARQAAGSRGGLEVVPGGLEVVPGGAPGGGPVPRTQLLRAAAALLLAVIEDEPALAAELAGLLGQATPPPPAPAAPPWPGEPLTHSETRVLHYLPTHLGAPQIAAELYLSANTVKTHLRHLYRKLGAHTRQEAVQHARATGLLAAPSRRP